MQDTNDRQTEQAVGEISQMVERSQAPDSLAVTVWEGETALTPVQVPDQIMPVRPAHLDNAKD
jgi:hypothetical protein